MAADYWELVCASPAGGVDSVVNEGSSIDAQLDQRHLMLRGETVRERRAPFVVLALIQVVQSTFQHVKIMVSMLDSFLCSCPRSSVFAQ